jgi:hypothetical protein
MVHGYSGKGSIKLISKNYEDLKNRGAGEIFDGRFLFLTWHLKII